ncbi:MAG TPA: hypothetical protein VFN48_01385 [Solirubrobacteraceae bacterium]|nr:hypothetical protein [Solirubrobacteraceae bacterium]
MSFTDALSRISEIQQQMTALSTGVIAGGSTPTAPTPGSSTAATGGTGSSTNAAAFAAALAQAQNGATAGSTGAAGGAVSAAGLPSLGALGLGAAGTAGTGASALAGSPLGSALAAAGVTPAQLSALTGQSPSTSGAGPLSALPGVALPAAAQRQLTPNQQRFASALVADTGLNPAVVSAWLLAEENGGAAQSREAANNNDWLNIGYTDSGTLGASDAVWSDPVSAANATAGWLKGQATIPGYGTASSGIQSILATVGASPQAQISALQSSGWASSGYPDLPSLYTQVMGA